jgi:hypothetical protein
MEFLGIGSEEAYIELEDFQVRLVKRICKLDGQSKGFSGNLLRDPIG